MLDAILNHVVHKQISEKNRELTDLQIHIGKMQDHMKNLKEYQRPPKIQDQESLIQKLLHTEEKIQRVIYNLEGLSNN